VSTDNPSQQLDQSDRPTTPDDGCQDCSQNLAKVNCDVEGIAAQAKFNAENQPALVTAQTTYTETSTKYREQRALIASEVQDLRSQATHLVERARCLIRQDSVVECLQDAWDRVKTQLEGCAKPPCCSALDCSFPTDTTELDDQQLENLVSGHENRVAESKTCFESLAQEPAALTQRLADLKAKVAKINAQLAADPAKVDPKTVWAEAKVAHWHAKQFWAGFTEIADFVDCLCSVLTCWNDGTQALSLLVGERAARRCRKAAEEARCEALRTNTVSEILACYDKICAPSHDCGDKDKHTEPCDHNEETRSTAT
jgi:phage shock protein A